MFIKTHLGFMNPYILHHSNTQTPKNVYKNTLKINDTKTQVNEM